jgi:hypothetical protein
MSILKISGKVFGINTQPITNASIKIIDKDYGSSDDIIFRGTTNNNGKFYGKSRNWIDNNWINGWGGIRVPIPDIMQLEFTVRKGDKSHTGPYIHLNDYLSAPIICPWSNPLTLFAKIGNEEFYDAESTRDKLKELVSTHANFELEIFDPLVITAFSILTNGESITEEFVSNMTQGLEVIDPFTGTALILLALAALITASGTAAATVIISMAVFEAISTGRCSPEFENSTDIDNTGATKQTTKVKFNCQV